MKYILATLIGLSVFVGQGRHPVVQHRQVRSQWCFQIPSDHVMIYSCHPSEAACLAQREFLQRDPHVHDLSVCTRRGQ